MPYFSVCIPLYNKANFITKTIQSVLDQHFTDFEIVICDDGSTDDSAKKIEKFHDKRIKLIRQKNQGASAARNRAIKESTGEYIAFLDADDLWYATHLTHLHYLIDHYPQAKLFATNYEIQMPDGRKRLPFFSKQIYIGIIDDYFLASLSDAVMTCFNAAVHRSVFDEIGYFNSDYRTGQDVDFAIKANLKFKLAYHNLVSVTYHRETENNLAQSKLNADRLKYIESYDKDAKDNKSLARYLAVNRFALIIKSKQAGDNIWKQALVKLDTGYLNKKQRFLLQFNSFQLKKMKQLQDFFSKKGIYLSPFKD